MALTEVDFSDPCELLNALSCTNPQWAQANPHQAMQAHMECEVGTCITKTVAYRTLVERGVIVPDSSRT